jgi:WD40 repeat protein
MATGASAPEGASAGTVTGEALTARVFISYAREDKSFVQRVHDALGAAGRDVWVDWRIPYTADWRQEVLAGIDASDAFVVVLSPDWIASSECRVELDRAVAGGKRLVPLLRGEVDPAATPEIVAALNWIPARADERFDDVIARLVTTLDTNLERVKAHTHHEVEAREWLASGEDRSHLLRGASLRAAEQYLLDATSDPVPTPLQLRYITASRRAAVRTQRRLVGAISTALIVSIALGVLALVQRDRAVEQSHVAGSRALAAESLRIVDSNADGALRLAIDAMDKERTPEAVTALRAAIAKPSVVENVGGTRDRAKALARSSDGRWVMVARQRGALELWDTETRRVQLLCGRQPDVRYANFSADGRFVVTTALGRDAVVWSVPERGVSSTHCEDRAVASVPGPSRTAAVLDSDGSRAAVVTLEGIINITDVAENSPARDPLCCHIADSVELNSDGTRIATRSNSDNRQGVVRVWNLADGQSLSIERSSPINVAHFSHDGTLMVTAGEYGQVELWDVASGQAPVPPLPHDGEVTDAEFDSRDQFLMTAAHDGNARVWEVANGAANVTLPHAAPLMTASFADTRPFVLTTDGSNSLSLWDAPDERQLETTSVPGRIKLASLTPSGTLTFIEQKDTGVLRLWRQRTWRLVSLLDTGDGPVASNEEAFSENRRRFAVAVGGQRVVQVHRFPSAETIGKAVSPNCRGLPWDIIAFAISPNGRTLASNAYALNAGVPCNTEIWDADTGTKEAQVGVANPLGALAFSRDSRLLAIGDDADAATVWLADVGKQVATCSHPRSAALGPGDPAVSAVAFGKGDMLATGAADHKVRLWDVTRCARPLAVLDGHGDTVISAAFSPKGDALVTGSIDHTAIVWDVRTRQKRVVLRGHADEVVGVDFSRDGQFIVTRSGDNTYRIWDATTGAPVDKGPMLYRSTGIAAVTFAHSSSSVLMTNSYAIFDAPCAACKPVDRLLTEARHRRAQLS